MEFQTKVGSWARKTFPSGTPKSWCAHIMREAKELQDAPSDPKEAADILILLMGLAHINGYDLMGEAQKKMEVNYRRKWGQPDHEGVIEHID